MSDLIRRKDVLKLVRDRTYDLSNDTQRELMLNAVNNIPSAEPEGTVGATKEQMVFLSVVLNELRKDEDSFDLLSRHGIFFFVMEEDNDLCVEWHFRNMAIAFDIEEKVINSCWTLSSTREAGNYSIGGFFHNDGINKVVSRIYEILREQKDGLDYRGEDEDA